MFNEDLGVDYSVKPKRTTIDVPDFLGGSEEYIEDEEAKAILNNVPGNTDIEEMNHLNELESVCRNWSEKEWRRVLYYAPHTFITDEIERRFKADDEVRNSVKYLGDFLTQVKM